MHEEIKQEAHKELPNEGNERQEMVVEHRVMVTEHHMLTGNCPACGKEISTAHPIALEAYDKGNVTKPRCEECGQKLIVLGRSRIIADRDPKRIIVPNAGQNRKQRRMKAVK